MVGTLDLDRLITAAMGRGASVRFVGDDRQLASVKAGGVLRDIARTAGAVRLETVVRFTDPVEGVASLALRDGDAGALGYYLANGRVHSGDAGSSLDQAYRAWSADCAAGLDSILLAATRAQVQRLNRRAQSDRLPGDRGAGVHLYDATDAHVGDVIIARRNNRHLSLTASDWVKNGDRFRVDAVNPAGRSTGRGRLLVARLRQVHHLGRRRGLRRGGQPAAVDRLGDVESVRDPGGPVSALHRVRSGDTQEIFRLPPSPSRRGGRAAAPATKYRPHESKQGSTNNRSRRTTTMTSQTRTHSPEAPMPHPVRTLELVTGRLLLTNEQAAERIGVCRTTLFHLLKTGQVRSVQIGRSRRITPQALVEYVARLVEASGGDRI